LLVIRDALQPHAADLAEGLWRRLKQPRTSPAQRLRILAALAAFDPETPRWKDAAPQALEPWLSDNPLYLGAWTETLRPARTFLLGPLTEVFKGKRLPELRPVAASILADYARDRPETLADLMVEADDRQFATLLPVLTRHRARVLPILEREVGRQPQPEATEAARQTLARRQSGAGLALLKLGQDKAVWPLLKHSEYPETRSRLTLRLGPLGIDAGTLAARLEQEKDVSARRALILALGEYSAEQVPEELRKRLVRTLLRWYRTDSDPGIHSAIDWLLRHGKDGPVARPLDWKQAKELEKIDSDLAARGRARRNWYVNSQGQTLAVVDARKPFLMGSPGDEAGHEDHEKQYWRLIGRRFVLGTKLVTVAQFKRFLKAHPEIEHTYPSKYSPEDEGPIINVTWFEAAQYCRWLSDQEGFGKNDRVYPPVKEIEKCKDGVTPLKMPADYLKRKGYRLPTEAEWEFACRAGARTSCYFGSALELLPRYSWFLGNNANRTWPVGQKRPNDLGLFDMHGNVWNWCQDRYEEYPAGTRDRPARDEEDSRPIVERFNRVLRGSSFTYHPTGARASYRFVRRPGNRIYSAGLRVASTLP
jgi:formylglycine-generating enzyme required for sulfatase activity